MYEIKLSKIRETYIGLKYKNTYVNDQKCELSKGGPTKKTT